MFALQELRDINIDVPCEIKTIEWDQVNVPGNLVSQVCCTPRGIYCDLTGACIPSRSTLTARSIAV